MLERLYELNLVNIMHSLEAAAFPEALRLARECMGVKQFAAAEYLGFTQPRYKKIEAGQAYKGCSFEEIRRMAMFYKLKQDWLQAKHNAFINKTKAAKISNTKRVWDECRDDDLREADSQGTSSDKEDEGEDGDIRSSERRQEHGTLADDLQDEGEGLDRPSCSGGSLLQTAREALARHKQARCR